ncbi:MAG: PAS domain-containing protein [Methanomicrobiales archaeon]|nr:PAS domain-containing protein [Methanomicrobiales archaeon]
MAAVGFQEEEKGKGRGAFNPLAICLIFLVFGILWILFTGILLPIVTGNPGLSGEVSAVREWGLVIGGTALLYLLLRHYTGTLKESEEQYRTLVENAGSIILTMDRDGKITFFNRYAEELFGFSRREIIGSNVIGTIVPATESSGRDLDQLMQDLLASPGRFVKNRNENVTSTGKRVWVLWTNRAMYDREGYIAGVLSVGNEIPEEKPRS